MVLGYHRCSPMTAEIRYQFAGKFEGTNIRTFILDLYYTTIIGPARLAEVSSYGFMDE